jgi:hypothetical protein
MPNSSKNRQPGFLKKGQTSPSHGAPSPPYQNSRLKARDYLFRWGPAITFMAFIYLLSDQPKNGGIIPDLGEMDFFLKKLAHFLEYGLLALLLLRAVRGLRPITWRLIAWTLILTVLYAATDEYHQTFVPGREGRWQDVIIDASGALLALTIRWRDL